MQPSPSTRYRAAVAALACAVCLAGFGLRFAATGTTVADLRARFATPPDDARIMMRWWWFGPAVTNAGIERELTRMKEAGIGGVEIQPVYPLTFDRADGSVRNLRFLSPEFADALAFASRKGRELGLRVDLTLGSGWPYGGPQVTVDHAAGRLRWHRERVPAGTSRVPLPHLAAGESLIAIFIGPEGDAPPSPERLHRVTDVRDGIVTVAPAGTARSLWVFIASRTGMMVKRAAVGAEGFVLDHYSRPALDRYLETVGGPLVDAFGAEPPFAIFCDSLEVFGSDWADGFLDEFRKRRGYDLLPHLPALVEGQGAHTRALHHDWALTLSELLEERFLAPLAEWARARGTRLRAQSYGTPPATLSSNRLIDLSEGEGWDWRSVTASRWAASAARVNGRPIASSETWTWLHSPAFRATPLDMKAEADRHFLQGITQLIGHGWPYTAEGEAYPGWRFYAAAVFNDSNPWWIVMPDISAYLQRLTYAMRAGAPVTRVAVYLPTSDALASLTPGRVHLLDAIRERVGRDVLGRVLDAGHTFDFVDDGVLRGAIVEGGEIRAGAGRYGVVVLPGVETMPIESLRVLRGLVRGGGTIVATRRTPGALPGARVDEASRAEFDTIARELFGGASPRVQIVPAEDGTLTERLRAVSTPDLSFAPEAPAIGFVHRRLPDGDVYFIANTSNVRQRTRATFDVRRRRAEWWDPTTGLVRAASVARSPAGAAVDLDLAPYESRLIVFADSADARSTQRAPRNAGNGTSGSDGSSSASLDISTGWKVAFGSLGRTVDMPVLRSWTDDPELRHYSGVATYVREVEVPAALLEGHGALMLDVGEGTPVEEVKLTNGMRAWLDGPVREAAVVHVNGRRAGAIWAPPYRVRIDEHLRAGRNEIRIDVANLAINHIAGRPLPDYRLLNLRYGVRFEPQDMDKVRPVPSGLFGPVTIRRMAVE